MKPIKNFLYISNVFSDRLTLVRAAKAASCSALALILGLGFSACSESTKTAGGGPSGTEAGNAITAVIVTEGAAPAALAKVRLMDRENLDGKIAYEASTDKNGFVSIEGVADGDYTLEAKLNGEALQQNVKVSSESIELGTENLKKVASISGYIGNGGDSGIVKVRGLAYSAKVEKGAFTLDSLPEGSISLVYIPEGSGDTTSSYTKVLAGEKATVQSFVAEKNSIVLEDFEDLDNRHRYAPAFTDDGGWWYITSDSSVTITFADSSLSYLPLEKVDGNGRVHFTLDFPEESVGYPWVSFGVQIGDKTEEVIPTYDLSSVDSIKFVASGRGNFVLQLIDENLEESFRTLAQAEYTLSETPTVYSIPLAGGIVADDALEILTHINLISFLFTQNANQSTEFIFDNLELVGADKHSIWKR